MQVKNIKTYTSNNAYIHISSPSGYYLDAQGNKITVSDLQHKKDMLAKVVNGEIASTTDPKYIKREYNKTGGESSPSFQKSVEFQDNFDHIVIEGFPSNIDEETAKKYTKILEEKFKNVQVFYMDQGKPYFYSASDRQVLTRMDKDNTGEYHLHVFANRMAITSKDDIFAYEILNSQSIEENPELKRAIDKAKGFMTVAGKDKALEQSCDFNEPYLQKALLSQINEELTNNGLAKIPSWGSYTQNGNSNNRTTQETKKITADIQAQNYSDEAVEEAIEVINNEKVTSLDGVIIQRKMTDNQKRLAEIAEEMRRINAENRQLEEAQTAINELAKSRYENDNLNKAIEKVNAEIAEITKAKEELSNSFNQVKTEISELRNTLDLPVEVPLLTAITGKLEEKDNDYQAVVEEKIELETQFKNELITKSEEIAEKEVLIDNLNDQVKDLSTVKLENGLLKSTIEQKDGVIASKDSVIATKDSQLEMEKKYREDMEARYSKLEEKFNILANRSNEQEEANRQLLEQNTRMAHAMETMKGSYDKLEAQQKEQASTIKELQATNEKLTSDLATKDKAIAVLTELYTEVKNKLVSTTSRLKASLTKLANGEVKNSIKKVVEENNGFNATLKALEADNEKTALDIQEARQRFKDRAEVDKKAAQTPKARNEDSKEIKPK